MGISSFFASLFQKEDERKQVDVKKEDRPPQDRKLEPVRSQELQPAAGEKTEPAAWQTGERQQPSPESDGRGKMKKAAAAGYGDGTPKENHTEKKKQEEQQEKKADEKKAYYQAKKELYQDINRIMRILYEADRENTWDSLTALEGPSQEAGPVIDKVMEELPDKLSGLLAPFTDKEKLDKPALLRPAYLNMMLPFYPAYHTYFEEFRYNTFLNRDSLELFRRLTGRKFRLGYRNRYENGIAAFEWQGNRYRVYDSRGNLLCDAVFENGQVKDGFAIRAEEAGDDPDWRVRRKGTYRNGQCMEESVEYLYQPVIF